jgi:hypothetical protein
MSKTVNSFAMAVLLSMASFGASAQTTTGSFGCISNNSGSCSSLEPYFEWSFTEAGATDTLTISNLFTTSQPFIGGLYFDAGAGDSVSFLSGTGTVAGTLYTQAAQPGNQNLPGGNGADPDFATDFYFAFSPPPSGYGVNGGESITFSLTGVSSADLLAGLFRVGLHVQGVNPDNQFSEGLVSTPPIPEPSTYALMLAGLGAVGFMARRRRLKA